jgi:hypothetical protein
MEKSSAIMGVFFAVTSSYTIFENESHLAQQLGPKINTIADQVADVSVPILLPPPKDISSELCCLEDGQTDYVYELKNSVRLQQGKIATLREAEQRYNQQLQQVYESGARLEELEKKAKSQKFAEEIRASNAAIQNGIKNWVSNDKQINLLAAKNSSYRQQYLADDENVGLVLNNAMTEKRKQTDKQRAAVDSRIRYLNEVYRRQQAFMHQKLNNFGGTKPGIKLPAYY